MALLAVSVLSSCFLLTGGQGTITTILIQVEPEHPLERESVTLTPKEDPSKFKTCRWFRGRTTEVGNLIFTLFPPNPEPGNRGPAYTYQMSGGTDCSLTIQNLTSGNAGNYTLSVDGIGVTGVGYASVVVAVFLLKPTVSVTPNSFIPEFTDSVQLKCSTNSRDANVSWLWKGESLPNNSRIHLSDDDWILSISNIERSDAGVYQCRVSNAASNETSDNANIDVVYGPDVPVIQPDTPYYFVHTDIELSCAADSFPAANFSWDFNEKELISGYKVILNNVTRHNSGNYTCRAENVLTHTTNSATLAIVVVGDVYDVTIVGPPTAIENEPVSLNCTCIGANISYSWFKGDQLIQPGENVVLENNNQTLMFDLSTRNDSANYTCYAHNNYSSNSSGPYWLDISYGPDPPIISPQELIYSVGSNLSLSCFAISNPPANYSWYLNGERLEQETTSQLLIRNLSENHEGIYTCSATNDITRHASNDSLEISLQKPVTDVTIIGPDEAIENNVTVLICNSDGTNVSYYWLKDNQILMTPEMSQHILLNDNNRNLTFNPAMRDDTGNYTCYANNSLSNVSANHALDVFYGPEVPMIIPNNISKYHAEGTNLSMSCEADSHPPAQYSWLFNTSIEIGNQSHLFLWNLNITNTGSYSCRAFNNKTSNDSVSISPVEINVRQILPTPTLESAADMVEENTNVTLNCITSNSTGVTVIWFKDDGPLSSTTPPSDNNRTLVLTHITKSDTGSYRCKVDNIVSKAESEPFNLTVAYGPEVKMNPEGTIEKSLNSILKLECTADSVPDSRFQWLFNNITQNVTGNIFLVQLRNWTDEGNYTCLATNPFTNRTAFRTAYVKLTEESNGSDGGLSGGAIAGIVIGCLVGVIFISGLLYFICTKTSFGRKELHTSNGNVPSAPGHNEGVTDTKPKAAEEDIQYSILAFKDNNRSPPPRPTSEAPQPSDGVTIYSEIKKK